MMSLMTVERILAVVVLPTSVEVQVFQILRLWPGVLKSKQDLISTLATMMVTKLKNSSRMENRDLPSRASILPMDQLVETPEC